MKLFNPESRFMEALSTISDLMILNLVTLVCCLPVITIGAALTGMHYGKTRRRLHSEKLFQIL